jgi:hypothetical protein
METGSRRGDVKAAMTFILGGRADHGRPSLEFVANDPASVASLALKDNLPPRKLRGTWSSAEGLMSVRDHLFHRLVGACEHGRRKGEARD